MHSFGKNRSNLSFQLPGICLSVRFNQCLLKNTVCLIRLLHRGVSWQIIKVFKDMLNFIRENSAYNCINYFSYMLDIAICGFLEYIFHDNVGIWMEFIPHFERKLVKLSKRSKDSNIFRLWQDCWNQKKNTLKDVKVDKQSQTLWNYVCLWYTLCHKHIW